jgi:hypothetical protein
MNYFPLPKAYIHLLAEEYAIALSLLGRYAHLIGGLTSSTISGNPGGMMAGSAEFNRIEKLHREGRYRGSRSHYWLHRLASKPTAHETRQTIAQPQADVMARALKFAEAESARPNYLSKLGEVPQPNARILDRQAGHIHALIFIDNNSSMPTLLMIESTPASKTTCDVCIRGVTLEGLRRFRRGQLFVDHFIPDVARRCLAALHAQSN